MYYSMAQQLNSIIRYKQKKKKAAPCKHVLGIEDIISVERPIEDSVDEFYHFMDDISYRARIFDLFTMYPNMVRRLEPEYTVLKRMVMNEHVDVCLVEIKNMMVYGDTDGNHEIAKNMKKTMVYIDGKPFEQCMFLLICDVASKTENIPDTYDGEISTIDRYVEKAPSGSFNRKHENDKNVLTEEEAFWGHCSNIQAWIELDYNPDAMASSISFNLLKKLAEVGDAKAKRVLDAEISDRLSSGSESVVLTLLESKVDIPLDVLLACLGKYEPHTLSYFRIVAKITAQTGMDTMRHEIVLETNDLVHTLYGVAREVRAREAAEGSFD